MGQARVKTILKRNFAERFLIFFEAEAFLPESFLNSLGKIKIQAISSTKTRISFIPVTIWFLNIEYDFNVSFISNIAFFVNEIQLQFSNYSSIFVFPISFLILVFLKWTWYFTRLKNIGERVCLIKKIRKTAKLLI